MVDAFVEFVELLVVFVSLLGSWSFRPSPLQRACRSYEVFIFILERVAKGDMLG